MNGLDLGTMSDVAASANDPIFLCHHTMIDYIFEQWLKKNPSAVYVGPNTRVYPTLKGHGPTDTLVPFIPLISNNQAFKLASSFGYQYVSAANPPSTAAISSDLTIGPCFTLVLLTLLLAVMTMKI